MYICSEDFEGIQNVFAKWKLIVQRTEMESCVTWCNDNPLKPNIRGTENTCEAMTDENASNCSRCNEIPSRHSWDITFTRMRRMGGQPDNIMPLASAVADALKRVSAFNGGKQINKMCTCSFILIELINTALNFSLKTVHKMCKKWLTKK